MNGQFTIRPCTDKSEFLECIELQREVWQFSDLDVMPLRAFVINQHSGGITLGAFDVEGRMIGFSHALPAFDRDFKPFYYSHMLAVTSGWRDAGVGWQLKLSQREHALRGGVSLIKWTFDPLQSRNAYLNIHKLGGLVREYHVNYYGNSSTSTLHRGLDTDRLFVEWWLSSVRVRRALGDEVSDRESSPSEPAGYVTIPRDIERLKGGDMASVREIQLRVREGFNGYIQRGHCCAGFEAPPGGESRYLFYQCEPVGNVLGK